MCFRCTARPTKERPETLRCSSGFPAREKPRYPPIRADEHGWGDRGVFNIEGGCYAKVANLSRKAEPEIYDAIRYGTILENVVYDEVTRAVDFADASITVNTRASYPIEYVANAKIPCVGGHPKNIVFLTYDAFGVLPPVAKLTPGQAMYHFISGYTARVAGAEQGVKEPEATFSACLGAAFMVWPPGKYAELLAEKMRGHGADSWLVNTGLTGGPYGVGKRIALRRTRRIIDAIHDKTLREAPVRADPVFGFAVPTACPGLPAELLSPRATWADPAAYDAQARALAKRFAENFERYRAAASPEMLAGGPVLP